MSGWRRRNAFVEAFLGFDPRGERAGRRLAVDASTRRPKQATKCVLQGEIPG